MKKPYTYCLPMLVGAFGAATMGCLPTGETDVAKYNASNYAPNSDGTGFAGTWIITNNNDSSAPISPYVAYYSRDLVRIKPAAEAADTYEVTHCSYYDPVITRSTVVASGNAVALPIGAEFSAGNPIYTVASEGRLITTVTDGGLSITWRAVRVSSDPDFNAGTVGVDFTGDGVTAIKQPAVCFAELQTTEDIGDNYLLTAIGESATGYASAQLWKQPSETFISGADEPPFWFGHTFEGTALTNTLQSTTKSLKGGARTLGYSTDGGGSFTLNVTLTATP